MATYYIVGGELKHHGVKGMKWGVRKQRKSTRLSAEDAARETQKYQAQAVKRKAAAKPAAKPASRPVPKKPMQKPRDDYDDYDPYSYDLGRNTTQSWLSKHKKQVFIGSAVAVGAGAIIARKWLKKKGITNFSQFKSYAKSMFGS